MTHDDIRDVVAHDIAPEDVDWLIDSPLIPERGITIITGFRGATKTTLACWLAAQVTAKRRVVFFATQEDDIRTHVRPRMEAAGADLSLVRFPDEDDPPLFFPRDTDRLERYIGERKTKLVLLDPLSAFISGITSPDKARLAMASLARLSRRYDCAFVFLHHFRKSGGKSAFDAMGGSGVLTDVARAVYVYGKLPPRPRKHRPSIELEELLGEGSEAEVEEEEPTYDKRALAALKLSSAEVTEEALLFQLETVAVEGVRAEVPRVVHLIGAEFSMGAERLFRAQVPPKVVDSDTAHMVQQGCTFLLDFLADGPKSTKETEETAKEAGVSKRTLERARGRLKVISFKKGTTWFLKLPDTPDTLPEEWTR